MKYGIDKFIGKWRDSDGYQLEIKKVDDTHAMVSLFAPSGNGIFLPYWEGHDTTNLFAEFDDYEGDFSILLWDKDKGFNMHLVYYPFVGSIDDGIEIVAPSISQYAEDDYLDKYRCLFGNLKDYKRK